MASDADDSGLLTNLLAVTDTGALPAPWTCCCAGCTTLPDGAQGGIAPGSYATTPTDDAYRFVAQAQAPQQGSGGDIAALMAGSKWTSLDSGSAKTIVTYSFASPQTSTFSSSNPEFQASLAEFSDSDQQLTRDVLAKIEAVANVQFVEVADNAIEVGVVRYGYSQQPNAMNFAGYAFFPSSAAIGGDVWIGAAQAGAQWDFYRPNLILHETLHALGLKHPFGSGAVLAAGQDIIPNTVMSYSPVAGGTSGYMSKYPAEPMPLDIAALQYLYGASSLNAGDTVYDLASSPFQSGFHAVWDAGGTNTLDASRVGRAVALDLSEGGRSDVGTKVTASASVGGAVVNTTYTSTLSIAAGTVVQNAVGTSYDDAIIGNGAGNWLRGSAGHDRLEGRGGDDLLVGGSGNDVLDGGDGLDTAVYEAARAGFTVARGGAGFTVSGGPAGTDSLTAVERLSFTDMRLALDLDGSAGMAAKLVGAVFGASVLQNKSVVGIGLALLDGGMRYADLMQLALNVKTGGAPSNEAVVDVLFANVFGALTPVPARAAYVDMLDRGVLSQSALGQTAADIDVNLANIDLVGLASRGLEYIV
jgi:serralysin